MSKADDWLHVSPATALILALIFPIAYGLYDFFENKKCNMFSIIGFASILLTGTIGLMHLPKEYIAIKEALVPLILGGVVLCSAFTKHPLVEMLLFNDSFLKMDVVNKIIDEQNKQHVITNMKKKYTMYFASSFLLSAILNFILAKILIHSETGTVEFNKELGRMTFWSYPVIVLPCTIVLMLILCRTINDIEKSLKVNFEEIIRIGQK
jgi:intracellular septation protein A